MVVSTEKSPVPNILNALADFSFLSVIFHEFTLPLLKKEGV